MKLIKMHRIVQSSVKTVLHMIIINTVVYNDFDAGQYFLAWNFYTFHPISKVWHWHITEIELDLWSLN